MPDTHFSYDGLPLVQPEKQIRLFTLDHNLVGDAEISGSLTVHDLERCPPYTAISYTWGDQVPKLRISINGLALVVQHNCWYALWQMHYHRQHSTFWIDQICIDQQNVEEKNTQVAAMGTIYGGAAVVASCLGSGRSLEALRKYDSQEDDRDPATQDALAALENLQHNSYFNRLWIKQEVILGKHVRLYCGTSWIEWEKFAELSVASKAAKLRSMKIRTSHPKSSKAVPVNHVRLIEGREQHWADVHDPGDSDEHDDSVQRPWLSLWQLITQYGDSHCQVGHDKFYAVLPLVSPVARSKLDLPVDYDSNLLSLALHTIRNVLHEMAATTDAQTPPVHVWFTIMKLVRDWLHLDLDDEGVQQFLAERSVLDGLPILTNARIRAMEQADRSPVYLRYILVQRFTITDMPLPELSWDETLPELECVSGAAKCSITDEMTADALHPYLCSRTTNEFRPDAEGDEDYSTYNGRYSLASLLSDLPVKVVQYAALDATFLVPPGTQSGDEILDIETASPGGQVFGYLPIVRRWAPDAEAGESPSSKLTYWALIGWALQVDRTGRLNTQMFVELSSPTGFRWPEYQETVAFDLHYEDLMMLAMLERNPAAMLTYGCMHDKHPSFMREPGGKLDTEEAVFQTVQKKLKFRDA